MKNKNIFLTGSNGFLGSYFIKSFSNIYNITTYKRESNNFITPEINVILHFAGKAHDLKNIQNVNDYYKDNTELTITLFDRFLTSSANIFITISSVKAIADVINEPLLEDSVPNPCTHYGKSKLMAEQYILTKELPQNKRFYILRPCMIHGPGNKGNLNLLYKIVNKGLPWPLGAFNNKRSFCSIDNLCFIIQELINNDEIPSGVYNIADDEPLSTNELIELISESYGVSKKIWVIPKFLIIPLSWVGDLFRFPLNSERLSKLTDTYVVSNNKIKKAINKSLPVSSKDGLIKTFNSFKSNA